MEASRTTVAAGSSRSLWKTIVVLFKLRIVALLVLAAAGGAMLAQAAGHSMDGLSWTLLLVTGTLSAAGSSGLNQYLERERDASMHRTARRPLVQGEIVQPRIVGLLATGMVLVGVLLAALFNPWLAVWEALGAFVYVVVYTLWLKPRTVLNIVIGGAAGSCAVISGGAASGGWDAPVVWLLALLLFVWTPVHFWALALAYEADYRHAAFPMLPSQTTPRTAAGWTVLHAGLTALCGLGLGLAMEPAFTPAYILPVLVITAFFLGGSARLLGAPDRAHAMALFHLSNLYLMVLLLAAIVASI